MNDTPRRSRTSAGLAAAATALAAFILNACHPDLSHSELETAIRARCAPVGDLLGKNIKASGQVRVAGVAGAGAVYEASGAILSSAEAVQIANIDTACRAWVAGAMSDEAYADNVAAQLAGAVSLTVPVEDQAERIASIGRDIERIRRSLPTRYPSIAEIAAGVSHLNAMPPAAVIAAVTSGLPADDDAGRQSDALALIVARLDYLEQLLAAEPANDQPTPGDDRRDVVARSDGFDVYFSTNSAELTFQALSEIQSRGQAWKVAGRAVEVVGFADARGTRELNQQLSERRANAVAEALSAIGLDVASRRGAGADATGATSYPRARRVQVTLVPRAG